MAQHAQLIEEVTLSHLKITTNSIFSNIMTMTFSL